MKMYFDEKNNLILMIHQWKFQMNTSIQVYFYKTNPNYIVYGETGVFPLSFEIETKYIQHWTKVIQKKQNSLLVNVYQYVHQQLCNALTNLPLFNWVYNIN